MADRTDPEFRAYFDLADELFDEDWSIDDFHPDVVADAWAAAQRLNLPWPPHLPDAEEHVLDRHARRRHARCNHTDT